MKPANKSTKSSWNREKMNVSVAYHFEGKFDGNGTDFCYVGGEVLTISEVNHDMFNVLDLEVGFKSEVRDIENVKLYYKKPLGKGVDAYRVILNDSHIRDLCSTYSSREVYDIYVEHVTSAVDVTRCLTDGESDESDEDYIENELLSESEDSDSEVGSWISEEEREEVEEIRRKVRAAKENLKIGVPFLCNNNGDAYESDGFGSDEVGYYDETDSDNEIYRMKSLYPKYDKNSTKPYFETSMTFNSMKEVREAIRKHAIIDRKDVRWVKNDSNRVRLECKWKGCNWLFFASPNKLFKVVQLKKYVPHVCPDHYRNKFVTPSVIAAHYKERIKSNPRWKNKHMRQTVREDFGCEVTITQCSRAKAKVLRTTFEAYKSEYALLRTYAEELLRVNPGSSIKIMVDSDNPKNEPFFQRMYVCFDSLKKGFLGGCRQFISLDGCFLKGLCKGELLTAIGRDANDQMYPIAWSVVEVESKASWDWFLEQLKLDLDIGNGFGWCLSSDQQKGLVPSIAELFPDADHRLCARHIYNNWLDNNMSESFNSLILEARHKPISSMLEDICMMCMEQICVKRELARKWKADFCPKILRKLAERAKGVRYCHIIGNGKDGYEMKLFELFGQLNSGTSSNGVRFQGVGVYTNVETGRTVINPGTTTETVVHHGSRQVGNSKDTGGTTNL
ncbi:hypothetical protein LINPERHAP2_LOCUS3081 [Linum perenne]